MTITERFTKETGGHPEKDEIRKKYLEAKSDKLDNVKMKRYLPVDIYLDTDDPKALETVNEAVRKLLESMDLEVCSTPEVFKGSIIEKFWVATKSIAANIDVIRKVADIIASFRKGHGQIKTDRLFYKKKPAIDVSETLKYLKNVPNISIRIGTLLITKSTSRDIPLIQMKNLTRQEVTLLDSHPKILRNPKNILQKLNALKQEKQMGSRMAMGL